MNLARFLARRLAQLLPVLVGITLVAFSLLHLVPGDPARAILGQKAPQAAVDQLRQQLGLDQPLPHQYLTFLGRLLHGDLGESRFYGQGVASLIAERLALTVALVALAGALAVVVAVPIAVASARNRNRWQDQLGRIVPMVGLGIPPFWIGLILLLVFGLKLGWFPVGGSGTDLISTAHALVLPAVTLSLGIAPLLVRSLRASLIEVFATDYIAAARAKGLSESRVLWRHVLRNAAGPAITVLAVNLGFLVGGTVVVEQVFALPGLGSLLVQAVSNRDFAVVQGLSIVFALLVVTINIVNDLVQVLLNPRLVLAT